jgi:hypothetical protein
LETTKGTAEENTFVSRVQYLHNTKPVLPELQNQLLQIPMETFMKAILLVEGDHQNHFLGLSFPTTAQALTPLEQAGRQGKVHLREGGRIRGRMAC